MEVEEEAYPSFSTERLRLKVRGQGTEAVHRKLDYNAPLLSVRSRLAEGGHGELKNKAWKLSGELSKEPLREPGAVPFTWEHTPGQPKQHGLPPAPSSPSPPATPSPPSLRRASPASPPLPPSPPPAPPLRPKFVRFQSSILFAPPPPPPPPPPPLPLHSPTLFLPKKSAPPPLPSTLPQNTDASTRGMRGFCLVEPSEGFLQLLLARRRKAEPEAFLSVEEPTNMEPPLNRIGDETKSNVVASNGFSNSVEQIDLIPSHECNEPSLMLNEVEDVKDDTCGVEINALVHSHHPDLINTPEMNLAETEEEDEDACGVEIDALVHSHHPGLINTKEMNLAETEEEDEDTRLPVHLGDVCNADIHNGTLVLPMGKDREDNITSTRIALTDKEVTSKVASIPNSEVVEAFEPKQALIKMDGHDRRNNKRIMSGIAILNSCKVESMGMIRNAVVRLCRKAVAASLRSLAKAKRKVAPTFRSSLDVAVHRTGKLFSEHGGSDIEEEAAILQERLTSETTKYEEHQIFATISTTEQEQQQPSAQTSTPEEEQQESAHHAHLPFGLESSPEHEQHQTEQEEQLLSMAGQPPLPPPSMVLQRPPPPPPPPPLSPPRPLHKVSSLKARLEREKSSAMRSTAHVYIRSMGDELNEFFDASSRFGSRSSTPRRTSSYRGLSKDWGSDSEFLDATSTPFETPRVSMSDNKSFISDMDTNQFLQSAASSSTSTMGLSSKPVSQLSKRVGKSLWLDTRELGAMPGKGDAISMSVFKSFMSGGELHRQSANVARKCQSGEQASSSSISCQHKRNASSRNGTLSSRAARTQASSAAFEITTGCKSSRGIEVSPVFPSKCQKNRSMASASGLPCRISVDTAEMGWPLGIADYPPVKASTITTTKVKEEETSLGNLIVPLPPLPASPAGGSWLRKALSSNTLNSHETFVRLQSRESPAKKPADRSPASASEYPVRKKGWEEIVKGSHHQPGHLRFSKELHSQPLPNLNSNKYYVS